MIELALVAPSRLAIVPAQDLLVLGAEARMNTPGQRDGNWRWRLSDGQLSDELAQRLRAVTEQAGRLQSTRALRRAVPTPEPSALPDAIGGSAPR
jgi:4-alpha-glucanotransferase